MIRKTKKIHLKEPDIFKQKLLEWAQQYDKIVWLDSNISSNLKNQNHSNFDVILAVEVEEEIECNNQNCFDKLKLFQTSINDYLFGYFGYDLKNDVEKLNSNNYDGLEFSDLYFFQPKKLFFFSGNSLEIKYLCQYSDELESDIDKILKTTTNARKLNSDFDEIKISKRITKDQYSEKLSHILDHIHRGDIYEVNFCQEFFAENTHIDPLLVYQKLNRISSSPFATFLKTDDKFLLSASPERFVKKQGNHIISQPIKGTARRHMDPNEDRKIAAHLEKDSKERAENIMIVDLVRNDLSKTAIKGSVRVKELCEVHTFKQVHQLISTVISTVKKDINSIDLIKSLFPMGSMTGAPKISAMEIIEEEEETKRGLYSGAVGYFTPENDFDFNVVIRSILYNETKKFVSFSVGGAITGKSNPENEYQECLLKAIAMKKALKN